MRKLIGLLALAAGVFATSALPAGAITGDSVKDNEHPFVGLVAFYDEEGQYSHRCSGSLLTPTVFLTAGHCTTDFFGSTATARVYFQQDAGANYDPQTGIDPHTGFPEECAPGTLGAACATSDELYDYDYATSGPPWREFPDIRDVGLVVLDQPISLSEYGALAADGTLDDLATRRGQKETTFTLSGYGLTRANPAYVVSPRERLMAKSRLTNLRSALTDGYSVRLGGNGNDEGGGCFGDSGGPVFYGGFSSNTIVALSGWWLGPRRVCTGSGYYYRTDRQEVVDWILETVPESEASEIDLVEP
jgi:trypsin